MTASDKDDVTRPPGEINISRAEYLAPAGLLHRTPSGKGPPKMNHGTAGNPEAVLIIALLITALIMFCWRTVLKLFIALIATGIILTIAYTAITIYQRT